MYKDEKGDLVSKEKLFQNMKHHITAIVERYKDVIYAWDVVNEAISDGGWQVRLWENPVFECGSAAAAPEEAAVQEQRYDLSAMELRYGHTAACTIPTKVTATQLKGRVLDEEIAEGAASARPRRLDFQRPLFLQQERRLTAAERGTAMHLVMQYLELDGPDPEEQVRRLTERRLLTPQQAEAVDMERIRAFLATPLAQEIRQARQVWRVRMS